MEQSHTLKFYFIRHGHADHNAAFDKAQDKSVYRSFDYKESKLTEKGALQIKNIVLPVKMDRIYSSPIIRCIETSRILVGENTFLHLHDGLMETQGPFPCNWRPDFDSLSRSLSRYILKDISLKYEPHTRYYLPNVCETREEISERVNKTVSEIKKECVNLNNVMIVTHNDVLEALFGRPFMNGEVYMVEY
uniref:Histidine phosphatase family protein n=1 Tax=viral metagenome TaxID=1070528 RepID=A0A6C0D5V3_9ZZZZ